MGTTHHGGRADDEKARDPTARDSAERVRLNYKPLLLFGKLILIQIRSTGRLKTRHQTTQGTDQNYLTGHTASN